MAHIPHPPTTLLHNTTTPTRPPCLKMKKSSSLSTKPFLSHHSHNHRGGGPSLRSILVLTALTLYGLQSFLSHFNATVSRRSSYPASTSSGNVRSSSRTTFGVPFPTAESTHQQRSGRSSSRRKQQHTYSPQEQREQQQRQQQQTWYNDHQTQHHHQETSDDHRTEFEKKYFSEPSPSYFSTYDDEEDNYYSSNYQNYDTQQQADTFGEYDEYGGAGTESRQILPGSDCKGYYCAETDTCVDRPLNCPCPHVLDTKCFRSDWFVCFRGPHKC
ncbi:hypothetical protein F5H01DRAFT_354677 [Linnemannia elongata]|nr:hypothetical protein F5H01DRAFT_354677 [Linnemannia elongata]